MKRVFQSTAGRLSAHSRWLAFCLPTAILFVVLAGCGGAVTNASTDSGTVPNGDSGASSNDGAEFADVFDADSAGEKPYGYIEIDQFPCEAGTCSELIVEFADLSASGSSPALDTCIVLSGSPSASDAGAPHPISAGVVRVSGGLSGPLTATPNDGGYAVISSGRAFSEGTSLVASSSGGDVPAFPGQTVVGPADLRLTSPLCPGSICSPVDRTTDWTFKWDSPLTGTISLVFGGSWSGAIYSEVHCRFDASKKVGVVPSGILAHLSPKSSSVHLSASNAVSFNSGGVPIDLVASSGLPTFYFAISK